jgi:hypothetical protein
MRCRVLSSFTGRLATRDAAQPKSPRRCRTFAPELSRGRATVELSLPEGEPSPDRGPAGVPAKCSVEDPDFRRLLRFDQLAIQTDLGPKRPFLVYNATLLKGSQSASHPALDRQDSTSHARNVVLPHT